MLPPKPEPCCLFPSKPTGCDIKTLIPCCLVTDWHLSLSRSTELVGTVQEDTLLLLFLPRLASGKCSVPAMWLKAHIHPSTILFLTLSSLASAGKRCYPCNPSSLSWDFGKTGHVSECGMTLHEPSISSVLFALWRWRKDWEFMRGVLSSLSKVPLCHGSWWSEYQCSRTLGKLWWFKVCVLSKV